MVILGGFPAVILAGLSRSFLFPSSRVRQIFFFLAIYFIILIYFDFFVVFFSFQSQRCFIFAKNIFRKLIAMPKKKKSADFCTYCPHSACKSQKNLCVLAVLMLC